MKNDFLGYSVFGIMETPFWEIKKKEPFDWEASDAKGLKPKQTSLLAIYFFSVIGCKISEEVWNKLSTSPKVQLRRLHTFELTNNFNKNES